MKTGNISMLLLSCFWFITCQNPAVAQEKPPRPMTVTALQPLSFGTFSTGTGGTVTIDSWGVRTVTAGIMAIGSATFCPATFEIDAEPGTMARWVGCDTTIDRDGGGGSMDLTIPSSANTFVSTVRSSGIIRVSIGGTLTVDAATPPGSYSCQFFITFYQE